MIQIKINSKKEKINYVDKKYLIFVDLLKNTDYNSNISGLTTTAVLTAVKNKIPDLSNLSKKKIDYSAILLDI